MKGAARAALSREMVAADPVAFLKRLWTLNEGRRAVGLKVFRAHSPRAHPYLLRDSGIRKVVLERENALASFSSFLVAEATGRWSSRGGGAPRGDLRIDFDPARFDRYVAERDRYFGRVTERAQGPLIRITYRDNIAGNRIRPLIRFLGLDEAAPLAARKKKQLTAAIADRFKQPEAVLRHLDKIGKPEWAEE